MGHAFTGRIHTEDQNQASFSPVSRHEVSVLIELTLGHLRYRLTDVPSAPKIRKTSLSGKLPKKSARHHCRENCPKPSNSGNRENCPKNPQDIIVGKTAQKRLIPEIAFSSIYAWLPQASYPCGNFSDTCS